YYYFHLLLHSPTISTLFPYTTLFRSISCEIILAFPMLSSKSVLIVALKNLSFARRPWYARRKYSSANALILVGSFTPLLLRLCRSEEHTSELQSRSDLVCRLLLEKKK